MPQSCPRFKFKVRPLPAVREALGHSFLTCEVVGRGAQRNEELKGASGGVPSALKSSYHLESSRGTESPRTPSVTLNGPRARAVPLCRVNKSQTKDPYGIPNGGSQVWGDSWAGRRPMALSRMRAGVGWGIISTPCPQDRFPL